MEKLLVTQALDERDFLKKKIIQQIQDASFVDVTKDSTDTALFANMNKNDFAIEAEASWNRITDMISRYNRIRAAIVESNANTKIKTSYGEYTVAAAIAMRDSLRAGGSEAFENMLLNAMSKTYSAAFAKTEVLNKELKSSAENMRMAILGKDAKTKVEDRPLAVVDEYVKENTAVVLDPIDVKKKIDALSEKRDKLLSELETQIKVSNATTTIEF